VIDIEAKRNELNKREDYLDVAKGITLFLVVLGHLVSFRGTAYTWIFSFHMMLFFFVSGYEFNAKKYGDYRFSKYLDKKVKCLLVPFAAAAGIGLVLSYTIPGWRIADMNITYTLLYLAQPATLHVGPIWFLLALFWVEIFFFYLYQKLLCKVSMTTVIFVLILISVIGFNVNKVTFLQYSRLPWKLDSSVTALVFYAVGFYAKETGFFRKLFNKKLLSAVIMIFAGSLGFYIAKCKNGYVNICDCQFSNYFYFYISAFCGITFILLLSKFLSKSRILQYYGKNTLWMFIVHIFLLSLSVSALNAVTKSQYVRSANIPFAYCLVLAILTYLVLALVPIIVNFCKTRISPYFSSVGSAGQGYTPQDKAS
jgi:acyltransferase